VTMTLTLSDDTGISSASVIWTQPTGLEEVADRIHMACGGQLSASTSGTQICTGSWTLGADHYSGVYELLEVQLIGPFGGQTVVTRYYGPGSSYNSKMEGHGRDGIALSWVGAGEGMTHSIDMPSITVD
jgi:hypothetical protein